MNKILNNSGFLDIKLIILSKKATRTKNYVRLNQGLQLFCTKYLSQMLLNFISVVSEKIVLKSNGHLILR